MTPNETLPADAAAAAALNLRPLPLGELLDRAFSLYFRNFVGFSALLAVVLIPGVLTSYFQTRGLLSFYFSLLHQIGTTRSQPDLSALNAITSYNPLTAVQLAIGVIIVPLSYAAVVVGVSRAYVGLPVTFADCYRHAVGRWLSILLLIVVWAVLIGVSFFVLVIGGAVIFGAFAFVGGLIARPFVGVVLALIFLITLIAGLIIGIMLYLTSAISLVSVVLERADPFRALSYGFARVFGGGMFWRSFVLSLALTGIYFGSFAVLGGAGSLLAYVFKLPALYFIAIGLMQLFFIPFAVVAAAVYYYDIRIRREGYDLQMLADQLSQSQLSAGSDA